jgi:4-hydroxybenzoate polyprenyltransferase
MEKESIQATIKMMGPIAWIALAAGLQMWGALLFVHASVDLILVITGATITFGVYLLNRFTDKEDSYNCPQQKILFQRRPLIIIIPIVLLVVSFSLLVFTGRLVAWHLILITCGIFYSVSFIPVLKNKSIGFIRIKDIFFIKNILVSFLWGITPFALAVNLGGYTPPRNDFFVIVLAFCLSALINSTSGDVRDIVGDRISGIVTFANYFGKKSTAVCLMVIGGLGCVSVEIYHYLGYASAPATMFFLIAVLWSGLVATPVYISKIHLPKLISEPLGDSQVVFNGIALIIFSLCV